MEFKRQESLNFPQIYKTFKVSDEEFYISDLTDDYFDAALELLVMYVMPEENFCKAIQIHKNPNAMKIMCENYRILFAKKTSLACFKKETNELVGLNILGVNTKGVEKVLSVSKIGVRRTAIILINNFRITIQTLKYYASLQDSHPSFMTFTRIVS